MSYIFYKPLKSSGLLHVDVSLISVLMKQLSIRSKEPSIKDIREVLNHDSVIILIAQHDSDIVGMITMNIKNTIEEKTGFIDDFVVLDEFRGRGIGLGLMDRILEVGEKQNLAYVDLTCDPKNPQRAAAHRMYEEFGFKVIGIVNGSSYYRKIIT